MSVSSDPPRVTGMEMQSLNPITKKEIPAYMTSAEYVLQERLKGERLLIQKTGDQIQACDSRQVVFGLLPPIEKSLGLFEADFVIDGIVVGEVFHVFDILIIDTEDLRSKVYLKRLSYLDFLFETKMWAQKNIEMVQSFQRLPLKVEAYKKFRREKAGVVFKNRNAPYVAGRPTRGGFQVEYSFGICRPKKP